MADEPQDTTEEPEEADDAAADETADEEPSPSGEADDDTSAAGEGPDVVQDAEGVAEVSDHSTKLDESEKADPLSPGQPRGVDPGTLKDRDPGPQA